ncbi:MAG: hypothetical protein WCF17_17515, partial [Terracidiphilus sp.]
IGSGTGTITILQQNVGDNDGWGSVSVSDYQLPSDVIGWLHNPAGGGTSNTVYGPALAVNQSTGFATTVAQGPSHSLYAYWQTCANCQWTGPLGIDGGDPNIAYSKPAIAFDQSTGLATVVVQGPNNSLDEYWQTSVDGQWAGPLGIDHGAANIAYSNPTLAINQTTGLPTVVVQGPSHSLDAYWQTCLSCQWTGPLGIDGGAADIAYSDPSMDFNQTTQLATVVAEGPSNSLYAYWQNSVDGQWTGPLGIDGGRGGIAYSDPSLVFNQTTQMATAVAEGPSHSLYAYWQNSVNGQWSGPLGIDGGAGNIAYSNPSIAFNQSGQIATVVDVGPSNSLYAYWQNGLNGQWTGPLGIDGGAGEVGYSDPAVDMVQSAGEATAVDEGPSNSLYAYWQTSTNGQWAGPLGLDAGDPGIAF